MGLHAHSNADNSRNQGLVVSGPHRKLHTLPVGMEMAPPPWQSHWRLLGAETRADTPAGRSFPGRLPTRQSEGTGSAKRPHVDDPPVRHSSPAERPGKRRSAPAMGLAQQAGAPTPAPRSRGGGRPGKGPHTPPP